MKTLGIVVVGSIALGSLGCAASASTVSEKYASTTQTTSWPSHRAAHCKDLPLDVPCRPADVGR
jgi:hypothetical protein